MVLKSLICSKVYTIGRRLPCFINRNTQTLSPTSMRSLRTILKAIISKTRLFRRGVCAKGMAAEEEDEEKAKEIWQLARDNLNTFKEVPSQ